MYLKCWVLEKAETSPFFQEAMITFRKVAFCGQGLQVKEETYFLMRTREGALENPHCWNYLSCGKKSDMMLEVGVWIQFCGLLTLWLGSSQPTITETHVTSLRRWRCHWALEDVMVPCIYLALAVGELRVKRLPLSHDMGGGILTYLFPGYHLATYQGQLIHFSFFCVCGSFQQAVKFPFF